MTEIRKFDNYCREAVIEGLESVLATKLIQKGRRKKWLADKKGRSFWVVGGKEYWHAIPEDMADAELREPTDGILIVAVLKTGAIVLYSGRVQNFIKHLDRLPRSKEKGDYQFNCTERGGALFVNEIPGFSLEYTGKFNFTSQDWKDIRVNKFLRDLGLGEEDEEDYFKVKS